MAKGHYTVVMYTNPDLEDASRKMSLALDPYRSRSDFTFVRVVDLRGDVPADDAWHGARRYPQGAGQGKRAA